jgi:hypothetical protein
MFVPMPAHGARRRLALRLFAIVVVTIALIAISGIATALLIAPAVLLVLPLLFGRYLGERAIHRLAGRVNELARADRVARLPRAPRLLGIRIAALATPGAGRAPPAVALI